MPGSAAGLRRVVNSDSATEIASPQAHPLAPGRLWTMLGMVTAPVLAADQLSKLYVKSHFQLYQSVTIVPDWLDLRYTLNPGAAFSLFASMPAGFRAPFFILLSIVAMVVLVALLAQRSTPLSSGIAFALILGGTIGNLIDRLAHGNVVYFIYFHHRSFSYPVFNIADSAITVGVAVILIFTSFGHTPPAAAAACREQLKKSGS
jgi:signal peptidase II